MRSFTTSFVYMFCSICALFAVPAFAVADEPNARAASLATAASPMTLELDAREAARGLMTAHLQIPVKAGSFTLVYPNGFPASISHPVLSPI